MQERTCYLLPMRVLLETMRELSASVTVQAQLAALPQGWNEPCRAELLLVEGRLSACTITTSEGLTLLQQEAAYQMLQRLGTLEWTVRADGRHPVHNEQASHAALSRQMAGCKGTFSIASGVLASLSRRHKQVLLLSESHKPPEEIARLLHLSVQQVEQILSTLHDRHLTSL